MTDKTQYANKKELKTNPQEQKRKKKTKSVYYYTEMGIRQVGQRKNLHTVPNHLCQHMSQSSGTHFAFKQQKTLPKYGTIILTCSIRILQEKKRDFFFLVLLKFMVPIRNFSMGDSSCLPQERFHVTELTAQCTILFLTLGWGGSSVGSASGLACC